MMGIRRVRPANGPTRPLWMNPPDVFSKLWPIMGVQQFEAAQGRLEFLKGVGDALQRKAKAISKAVQAVGQTCENRLKLELNSHFLLSAECKHQIYQGLARTVFLGASSVGNNFHEADLCNSLMTACA